MPRHLIHVGYPKAGSTFLQAWFERHPEIRYAPGGLGGFHDVYTMAIVPERSYRYHVTSCEGLSSPHRNPAEVPLTADGETGRFPERIRDAQSGVCALLSTLFPGSRILIVTRGFREIAYSGYSQYVRSGGVRHLDGMMRQFTADAGEEASHYFNFDYLIGLYADAFGPENVTVLPYELLREDQSRFLEVLEQELGVSHVEVELGRVNPSLSPAELYWYPVISRMVAAAASRLGRRRAQRAFRRYTTIPFHNRLRPLIRILARLSPGRRIGGNDFPDDLLSHCVGKADTLRTHPLYADYAREYLWDAASPDEPVPARDPLPEGTVG
jgi:hypothetical protein